MENKKRQSINRRDFLKTTTLAGGGLILSFSMVWGARKISSRPNQPASLHAFLRIGEDDSIYIILSKVEMGQGIWTTLPMLIAEELDCDWRKIKVQHRPSGKGSDFAESIYVQSTGGSDSTRSEFDRYRLVGATARAMLVQAASRKFGVLPEICRTEKGFVIAGNRRASYGELAIAASALAIPSVKLREPKEWKYIGKSQKRLDSPEKINGQAIYGIDIQFPGLLTAVVAHAPVFGGKVISFDSTRAKAIKGVRDVMQIPTGIAVLADNFWLAKLGREALQVEWNLDKNKGVDSNTQIEEYRELSKTQGIPVQQKGDIVDAASTSDIIEAEYIFPYLAHAPMEPLNCTVKIQGDSCEVWTGTQSPLPHQAEVARFLGLNPEQVIFNTPFLGGSFGRRGSFDADWIMEAVHIAKASGRFIKLVWSREDDIQGGYYRPVYLHRVYIGIGSNHIPLAWQHCIVGQSLFKNTPLEKDIAPNEIDYSSVDGVNGSPYFDSIPNLSIELHTTTCNVPVLPLRSVGNTHTGFVMETLIDELAAKVGKDPVEYRHILLKNHPRHLAALNLAAEKSGWNNPLPAGIYRGIAVHAAMGSYVSQVVELNIKDGKIHLRRIVCAIDCGLAVNPDGVRAQMESGIVYGLTAALYGEITLEKGRVKQRNFNDYRMLRTHETPSIEVYIVPSTERMGGAGEPGVPPIAPALANALYAATGKRIRRLPIRAEDWSK
ncbi:xanthine dehydrogenase family protein molybdopterin-binding subunit [Ohtaekwangia koreensis]|uniref:Isoquinoline 1-oxidoreductase, beta subunit n=1 Tax=Ohtaekwangia koreensis TaxID=688867 RepID=A0A1T5J614_9BACT|nr:xanthine dehydrogenase family protein molybdopterin-binding subunit [Ohtaekwangia koreensis]SKC46732.1 isoquinoline 1-oxidoreductase, beta subunit [Ohtaekwangia koreensis]